jgi:hypothetical protein
MIIYRSVDRNSFDDKYRFLILHVLTFQQEILFDCDYHSIQVERENQWDD